MRKKVSLVELAKVFLTIGTIGFGGGMAIIALIQDVCVDKKKWLDVNEFAHGVALGQFLGPFAVNTAIFVGYRLRGFVGALVSTVFFLIPSVILVIFFTAAYLHFNKVPSLQSALRGLTPVVVALILNAAFKMGKNKVKNIEDYSIILISMLLFLVLKIQAVAIILLAIVYGVVRTKFFMGKNGDV